MADKEIYKICSVPECGCRHHAKGFCKRHYARFCDHGDPLGGRPENGSAEKFYMNALAYDGDECLLWPYTFGGTGYGQMWVDGKLVYVHRVICEDTHGAAPTPQHQAAHSCGKGHMGCVTKKHLSWKTPKENQADRVAHGTDGKGERHPSAKLTEAQVREILKLKGEEPPRRLAKQYGVSFSTISEIHLGKSWRHVQ